MTLPADSHVHTQWSWDTTDGDMARTCERAIALGLPAVAFTEHVDFNSWRVLDPHLPENARLAALADENAVLTPPPMDVDGYLACLEECRDRYPELRVLSGVELGEPHWNREQAGALLRRGEFQRVLGSLHALPHEELYAEPPQLYREREATGVIREYLGEIPNLIAGFGEFTVLAHIDYPNRYWPTATLGPFDPALFEEEYRYALRALAATDRALEINTRLPLDAQILGWWRAEGGKAVTFGSDAHEPGLVGNGFAAAVDMAEAHGFERGRHPYDVWFRG